MRRLARRGRYRSDAVVNEAEAPERAIDSTPVIFVGLATAQQMQFARAFGDGFLDHHPEQKGAESRMRHSRVEPGNVGVPTAGVGQGIEKSHDDSANRQTVEPQLVLLEQAGRSGAVKPLNPRIGKNARVAS